MGEYKPEQTTELTPSQIAHLRSMGFNDQEIAQWEQRFRGTVNRPNTSEPYKSGVVMNPFKDTINLEDTELGLRQIRAIEPDEEF